LYRRTFCIYGRFVERTFCREGCYVEGRFVDGRFVEGRFVEGRFVLVPPKHLLISLVLYLLCLGNVTLFLWVIPFNWSTVVSVA
jgi:hypothetical protein